MHFWVVMKISIPVKVTMFLFFAFVTSFPLFGHFPRLVDSNFLVRTFSRVFLKAKSTAGPALYFLPHFVILDGMLACSEIFVSVANFSMMNPKQVKTSCMVSRCFVTHWVVS